VATLRNAGWTCLWLVHATHWIPPGIHISPTDLPPWIPVLVFCAPRTDPFDPNAPFLGIEQNVRSTASMVSLVPPIPRTSLHVPSEPQPPSPPYYACHRFDSPL